MTLKTASLADVGLLALTGAAQAREAWHAPRAGDWLITGRLTDVAPTADDAITTAAGAVTGLEVGVGDSVMPTLGFTYFIILWSLWRTRPKPLT